MDNNILAAGDYAIEQLDKIIQRGYRVDFNQALDARLVTDDFAECFARINHWRDKLLEFRRTRKGYEVHPFAQPYRDVNNLNIVPQWQTDLARWCNRGWTLACVPFGEFEPRKGFKCSEYFTNNDITL